MKAVFVNSSPKIKETASGEVIKIFKDYLNADEKIDLQWNGDSISDEDIQAVNESDVMIIAFPLYVDCLPSHTLRCLKQLENYIKSRRVVSPLRVFAAVQNGFFNAHQNRYAVEVIKNWCNRVNAVFVGGLCIGGGGMLVGLYDRVGDHGPLKPIVKEVKAACEKIADRTYQGGEVSMVEPAFPEFLYKQAAQMGFRQLAKANGLKPRDLNK